jgi:hypothetical protein
MDILDLFGHMTYFQGILKHPPTFRRYQLPSGGKSQGSVKIIDPVVPLAIGGQADPEAAPVIRLANEHADQIPAHPLALGRRTDCDREQTGASLRLFAGGPGRGSDQTTYDRRPVGNCPNNVQQESQEVPYEYPAVEACRA